MSRLTEIRLIPEQRGVVFVESFLTQAERQLFVAQVHGFSHSAQYAAEPLLRLTALSDSEAPLER